MKKNKMDKLLDGCNIINSNHNNDVKCNHSIIDNYNSNHNAQNVGEEKLFDNSCEKENKVQKQLKTIDICKLGIKNGIKKNDSVVFGTVIVEDDTCVFCLESGELIQFCYCSVMSHKDCAMEYISAPGLMNDKCCMCRRKLEYDVAKPNAPMRKRYIFLLALMIASIAVFSGMSIYMVMSLVPIENKSILVYVCIVSNISMTWSLMLMLLICAIVRYGTRSPCRKFSDDFCNCVNEEFVFCELCDRQGMAWSILLLCLYFTGVFLVAVVGAIQVYCISYVIFKFYKSFELKSKGGLKFEQERKVILCPSDLYNIEMIVR